MDLQSVEEQLNIVSAELEELRSTMNTAALSLDVAQSSMQVASGRVLAISQQLDVKINEYMHLSNVLKNAK